MIANLTVNVDGTQLTPTTDFTLVGDSILFTDDPITSSKIVAIYDLSTWNDDTLMEFIVDSVKVVASDLAVRWIFDPTGFTISDLDANKPIIFTDPKQPTVADDTIQKLIVYRAAISMIEEKVDAAADDAILIKDGDTTIDTSKTFAGGQSRLDRITEQYDKNLKVARMNRFTGCAANTTGLIYGSPFDQTPDRPSLPYIY